MPEPKPIPTKYNGVQYRSRLEARWALFFDQLGIDYRYEFEGFQLRSGWYLPDFYLPKHGWFEIKPRDANKEEREHGWDMVFDHFDLGKDREENGFNAMNQFYVLTGFPLEKTYDASYDCEITGNLWMENYETGEIYFAPNVYYKRQSEGQHLSYDYQLLEVEACAHCTQFYTCSSFGNRGNKGRLLVCTYQFLVDSHPLFSFDASSQIKEDLEIARCKAHSAYLQLSEEHDQIRKQCRYRKSARVDAAYELAKKFRFF